MEIYMYMCIVKMQEKVIKKKKIKITKAQKNNKIQTNSKY